MMDRSLLMVLRALSLALAVAVVSWAAPAAAAPATAPTSRAKRFRLHADTEFFGFTHFDDRTRPAMNRTDSNVVGFGVGRPTLTDSGACAGALFGACVLSVRPTWGLGFGYAFLEQRAVVGARFAFAVDGLFVDNAADHTFTFVGGQFVPYFRWIFMPGRTFRPYVEGRLGLGGGAASFRDDDDDRASVGVIYPTVGGGGGVHIFIIDAFSIDLGLNLDYMAPHDRTRTVTETPVGTVTNERGWEQVANVVNFSALAGFSVWFD